MTASKSNPDPQIHVAILKQDGQYIVATENSWSDGMARTDYNEYYAFWYEALEAAIKRCKAEQRLLRIHDSFPSAVCP